MFEAPLEGFVCARIGSEKVFRFGFFRLWGLTLSRLGSSGFGTDSLVWGYLGFVGIFCSVRPGPLWSV